MRHLADRARDLLGMASVGAAVAIAVAVLAGCAIPPAGVVRSVAWTVGDTGLTLAPPGDRGSVPLSSLDAYQRCIGGQASCAGGSPTAIELALAIDPGTNLIAPEGTVVWAIEWLDIECPRSSGGGVVEGSRPPAAPPGRCDEIAVVDATSGVYLFTQTGPHDPARP
jgi:hypothetical protein